MEMSCSPILIKGTVATESIASSRKTSPSPNPTHTLPHSPKSHHEQGLFSKIFKKSTLSRPSSGNYYAHRGKASGIQSEPPSFTGNSTDQEQDISTPTSPRISGNASPSSPFQTRDKSVSHYKAEITWHQVPGNTGLWQFFSSNPSTKAQHCVRIKPTSMLILTELEKATLREIALENLGQDLRQKMSPYIERLSPGGQSAVGNNTKTKKGRGKSVSKFFSRFSTLRFSTGSYSSSSRRSGVHRPKTRTNEAANQDKSVNPKNLPGKSLTTSNLVFGATLKRCLANEILAERKRLMRLERQQRCGRGFPFRNLEPLNLKEDCLKPETQKQAVRRRRLPINRRSSVNGFGSHMKFRIANKNDERGLSSRENQNNVVEFVTDDADSGFQDDGEAPSVKATSFDTGRRFEKCGDSAGPMPLQVPQFVKKCIRHIETYGLDVEGIFRQGTSKKRIQSQIAEIQRSFDFNFTADHSVHDTAALLKEFFRDLPEPLLTRSLYSAFIAVGTLDNKERAQSLLRLLVILLPSVHRDTLYYLLAFLRSVASHAGNQSNTLSGGNKMTSHNLATLFGPNILRMSGLIAGSCGPVATTVNFPEALSDIELKIEPPIKRQSSEHFIVESQDRADERNAVIDVVQLLIDDYDKIFEIPVELMDQMFQKMFEGNLGAILHNSTAVKSSLCMPPVEAVERLLFKHAGIRMSEPNLTDFNQSCSNDATTSGSIRQAPRPISIQDARIFSTSYSIQSSPGAAEKKQEAMSDEGSTKPTAEEKITPTIHPQVCATVSRSEGDLTAGTRRFDDPRFYRLTGRVRPRRYGDSYAAKIQINSDLLQDASTWDELRTAMARHPPGSQSQTLPRVTVTVTPSSAPDTPVPSLVHA